MAEEVTIPFDKFNRPPIRGVHDPDDDTINWSDFISSLFHHEVYMPVYIALRITVIVALPIGILCRHPHTINVFPTHSVMGLWGIVASQTAVGDQIATCITMYQLSIFMLVTGTIANSVNLLGNPGAWWCVTFFLPFVVSLLGDYRGKRLAILHTLLILQMEHTPGGTALIFPAKVCRDMCIVTTIALVQAFLPPITVSKQCDAMLAEGMRHYGRYLRTAVRACWAGDRIVADVALRQMSTQPLQRMFEDIQPKLFGVMYEFWESTLRLELRRERVARLKAAVTRMHVLSDVTRAVVSRRVFPDDDAANDKGKDKDCDAKESHEPFGAAEGVADTSSNASNAQHSPARETSGVVCRGDPEGMRPQAHALLEEPLERFLCAVEAVLEGMCRHLDPADVAAHVPFEELREATVAVEAALNRVHYELLIRGNAEVDPFAYVNTVYFHQTLVLIAESLLLYGDSMINFDRSRYKSQWERAWEFFFYDYWRAFWQELPHRLWPSRPRDVRMMKDGIKLACAYTVGAVYSIYMDPENVYFFGMAILMSVGLPTAGDTMVASVYRVTGMVIGCSIAYVAQWHTQDLVGELAVAMAGIFIALLFRDKFPYLHTAQYVSMLILPGLNSAPNKMMLLSRIVSNTFTVMSYYCIVVFVFRVDVLKVAATAQIAAVAAVTERFSGLADAATRPWQARGAPEQEAHTRLLIQRQAAARVPAWASLAAVAGLLPKAALEPTPLGMPYPLAEWRDVLSSLTHMASATDLMTSALVVLHRDREAETQAVVLRLYTAVQPALAEIDLHVRLLMLDFVAAFDRPFDWDAHEVHRHFASFKRLRQLLHRTFSTAHWEHVSALREGYRAGQPNATFAMDDNASFVFNTLESATQTANVSFAPVTAERRRTLLLLPRSFFATTTNNNNSIGVNGNSFATAAAAASTLLLPEECTLNTDVTMVVSLLVATDIFFMECERLLSCMYQINCYSRSVRPRRRLPCGL